MYCRGTDIILIGFSCSCLGIATGFVLGALVVSRSFQSFARRVVVLLAEILEPEVERSADLQWAPRNRELRRRRPLFLPDQ